MFTSRALLRWVFWLLSFGSIAVLLGQLYAVASMRLLGLALLVPASALMFVLWIAAKRSGDTDFELRLTAGLWGGIWGTIGYDLIRIPFHILGQNPMTPIRSYGTWLWGAGFSTPWSDILGFSYHLSNGITFGWIYSLLLFRRHWTLAVLWGLLLETLALASPFADVFAMRQAYPSIALAYFAHLFYGIPLGRLCQKPEAMLRARRWLAVLLLVGIVAWFLNAWQPLGQQPALRAGQILVGPNALYPGWTDAAIGSTIELENRLSQPAELIVRRPNQSRGPGENIRLDTGGKLSIKMSDSGVYQILLPAKPFRSVFISARRGQDYRPR